ncbi:MAG: pentapeptide repeat-containing protein [Deltaproteobacteria bacterium]|nr:pentapeptide repeat-containing protein [Deltaproteobacteria bacterium]
MTPKEFQAQVLKEIARSQEAGEKYCNLFSTIFPAVDFRYAKFDHVINFNDATFTQDAEFFHVEFTRNAYFSRVKFTQDTDFREASFTENAWFRDVTFTRNVDFSRATFTRKTDFGGATFAEAANFFRAKFTQGAYFFRTKFTQDANFSRTTYFECADFSSATFAEAANFFRAKFTQVAYFFRTKFTQVAYFGKAKFTQNADFRQANLGRAFFTGATFEKADFNLAKFTQDVYFPRTTFAQLVNFKDSFFEGTSKFEKTKFKKVEFKPLIIKGKVFFIDIDLTEVEISFLQTDLRQFQFECCQWPIKEEQFGDREVLWDEIAVDRLDPKTSLNYRTRKAAGYAEVGDLYRRLKQKYKEEHNEPEASKWHYNEKEMFRNSDKRRKNNPVSLTNLYYLSSGYAERPVRAFCALIVLFVLYVGVMKCVPLDFNPPCSAQASIRATGQVTAQVQIQAQPQVQTKIIGLLPVTAQAPTKAVEQAPAQAQTDEQTKRRIVMGINIDITRSPEPIRKEGTCTKRLMGSLEHILGAKNPEFEPATLWGKFLNILFTRLVIPFQAIFLGLALRNKFRR